MSTLKIASVLLIAVLQSIALFSSLQYSKLAPHNPIITFGLSAAFFYCLCVDLARDQLQNIAYYPVTNLIFLLTFTLSCIISKIKVINYFWPMVQLASIFMYILSQEYNLREIIYWQIQSPQYARHIIMIYLLLVSCTISHIGWGIMISKLVYLDNNNEGYTSLPIIQDIETQDYKNNIGNHNRMEKNAQNIEQKNIFTTLFTHSKENIEILKISVILFPFLINLLSIFFELISTQTEHEHGHEHKHVYFPNNALYFIDSTTQNQYNLFFHALRIICSAIMFHSLINFWSKLFDGKDKDSKEDRYEMKKNFGVITLGLIVAITRVFAERV